MSTSSVPQFTINKNHIQQHYDRLSHLYRFFWGDHLHHGYWDKKQSPKQAQIRLMERLAEETIVPRGTHVLDIGCGIGGSAFWLAKTFDCRVTGITISPVQAKMASKKAKALGLEDRLHFEVMDANRMTFPAESFDLVWIMESSEHFPDKGHFFNQCAALLKPGGRLAVCAWLRREGPIKEEEKALVTAIAETMMSASLGSLSDYETWVKESGLTLRYSADITRQVEHTWERCAKMAKGLLLKCILPFVDEPTRRFVRAFPLMSQAYAQGAMAFGLLSASKS